MDPLMKHFCQLNGYFEIYISTKNKKTDVSSFKSDCYCASLRCMQKTLCDTSKWNEVISTLKQEALPQHLRKVGWRGSLRTLSCKTEMFCFNAEMSLFKNVSRNIRWGNETKPKKRRKEKKKKNKWKKINIDLILTWK